MNQLVSVNEALMENYEGQEVPLYEVDGKMYLAGEDLGRMLGLAGRRSVNKIFERNRDELSPHTCRTRVVREEGGDVVSPPSSRTSRSGGPQTTRLYSEVGCYLVSMFAQTPKAKAFRLWLARLPRKHREMKECLSAASEQARQHGRKEGAAQASPPSMQETSVPDTWPETRLEALERAYFQGCGETVKMFVRICADREDVNGLLAVVHWRLKGMTQAETVKLTGLTLGTVQKHERLMRERGLVFPRGKGLKGLLELSAYEIGEMFFQADKKRARRETRSHLRRIK